MQSINWVQVITSVLIALISSTGLWSYIANYRNKHNAELYLCTCVSGGEEFEFYIIGFEREQ